MKLRNLQSRPALKSAGLHAKPKTMVLRCHRAQSNVVRPFQMKMF